MERIKDKKNALESYVYEMRDKVYSFMSSSLFPELTFCYQLLNWHAESMPSWLSNVFVECTIKLVDVLILFFHSLYKMWTKRLIWCMLFGLLWWWKAWQKIAWAFPLEFHMFRLGFIGACTGHLDNFTLRAFTAFRFHVTDFLLYTLSFLIFYFTCKMS
jgi:hypothetical protein